MAGARYEPNGSMDRLVSALPQASIPHVGNDTRRRDVSPRNQTTVNRSSTCRECKIYERP